jgi:hypothetical protein
MVYQFWHMLYPGKRYAHTTPVWDLYGLELGQTRGGRGVGGFWLPVCLHQSSSLVCTGAWFNHTKLKKFRIRLHLQIPIFLNSL